MPAEAAILEPKDGGSRQQKVRAAVKALAASDTFIDLLVAELEKSGALT